MTDIVERLRKASVYEYGEATYATYSPLGDEAADEIESLRKALEVHAHYAAEVERMRAEIERLRTPRKFKPRFRPRPEAKP